MNRIRLILADDHTMFAEGLKSLLDEEFELLGTVGNGRIWLISLTALILK